MSSNEVNDFVDMEDLSIVLSTSTPTQESSEEQVT
jgi:hypothetical protein